MAETLLIWPLAEQRPPGAFARFVVVDDEAGRPQLVAPMDLAIAGPPTAAGGPTRETADSLPLLLTLTGARPFSVTVTYLVRQDVNGVPRVQTVRTAPVQFRDFAPPDGNRLALLGLIRGGDADRPAQPIIRTVIDATLPESRGGPRGAYTDVDLADEVFRAHEGAGANRQGTGFVFAVPSVGNGTVGPVRTIVPYRDAKIRASARILRQPSDGSPDGASDAARWPRLSVRVGGSETNRAIFAPAVLFFSWNRLLASLQDHRQRERGPIDPAAALHRGTFEGADLAFAFKSAGFGDVIGMMVGPVDRAEQVFVGWGDNRRLVQYLPQNRLPRAWAVSLFHCTGDELIPLEYLGDVPDVGRIRDAANEEILRAANAWMPRGDEHFVSDAATFLLPRTRVPESDLTRLIRAAIEDARASIVAPDDDGHLLVLDHYCDLLRELDRQIKATSRPEEWPGLGRLFSFPRFLRLPQLHRALVVAPALRRMVVDGLESIEDLPDDGDLLAMALRMMRIHEPDRARKESWLDSLDMPGMLAAWELTRRDPACIDDLISLGIAPDFATLADHLAGRVAAQLKAYRDCAPERIAAAAAVRALLGHQDRERVLADVARHRDDGRGKATMPYEQIVGALADVAETEPLAAEIATIALALDAIVTPGRPDAARAWARLGAVGAAPPTFGWREWIDELPTEWARRGVASERRRALSQLVSMLADPKLDPIKMRVAALLWNLDADPPRR